jgi:glutathione S-transferase
MRMPRESMACLSISVTHLKLFSITIPEHHQHNFSTTSLLMRSITTSTLYSAWFCPYAQRAWIALNEFDIKFQLVESLKIDPVTEAYIKLPKLLEYNPKGLVPVLVEKVSNGSNNKEEEEEVVLCDSLAILKELYRQNHADATLLEESFEAAQKWNQQLCSSFYTVIMCQDPTKGKLHWDEMVKHLMEFCQHLPASSSEKVTAGRFFDSGQTPGMIDLTVFPFVHRMYLLEHYKGFKFPETTQAQRDAKEVLMAWQSHMEARPSVAATLATKEALTPIYLRYADGTAKSKVADSVRRGQNAHDV